MTIDKSRLEIIARLFTFPLRNVASRWLLRYCVVTERYLPKLRLLSYLALYLASSRIG